MIIKHGRHLEIYEVRKGFWAFVLDCAFRVLIGWADKLPSRGACNSSDLCYHLSA